MTFNVQTRHREPGLKADMFEAFRLKIAPPDRAERLIAKMIDPALFNWGTVPLTTVAKTHPEYSDNPTENNLQGQVAWHGCIWTMRNTTVIRALEDIGRHDLAGELPEGCIQVLQPVVPRQPVPKVTDLDSGLDLPVITHPSGLQSVVGVEVGMRRELNLRFDWAGE